MARKREFDEIEALRQAMELFWVQGYEKTSMEDLVNAMGVHRKSIYDTFGNKHELFIKTLAYYKTIVGEQLLQAIENENTAQGKIKALFDYTFMNNIEQSKGCLIVNTGVELSPHDQGIAEMVQSNFSETEDVIYKLLEMGKRTGEFSSTLNLMATTQFIHNALIGIRVQLKTAKDKDALKAIVETTLSILKKD